MTLAMLKTVEPDALPREEIEAAQDAVHALARLKGGSAGVRVQAKGDSEEQQAFVLPAHAVRLLMDILGFLAEGRGVSIMPEDAALTTNQAAQMLNMSRPHLIKLLTEGEIEYSMVGTHRRVLMQHLLAYHQKKTMLAKQAADELVAEAQELEMGY